MSRQCGPERQSVRATSCTRFSSRRAHLLHTIFVSARTPLRLHAIFVYARTPLAPAPGSSPGAHLPASSPDSSEIVFNPTLTYIRRLIPYARHPEFTKVGSEAHIIPVLIRLFTRICWFYLLFQFHCRTCLSSTLFDHALRSRHVDTWDPIPLAHPIPLAPTHKPPSPHLALTGHSRSDRSEHAKTEDNLAAVGQAVLEEAHKRQC